MKNNFVLIIETLHLPDSGDNANVSSTINRWLICFSFSFLFLFFLPFVLIFFIWKRYTLVLQRGKWCLVSFLLNIPLRPFFLLINVVKINIHKYILVLGVKKKSIVRFVAFWYCLEPGIYEREFCYLYWIATHRW